MIRTSVYTILASFVYISVSLLTRATANVNVYVYPSLFTTTNTDSVPLSLSQPITFSQFTAGLAHLYKVSHVAGLDLELMPEIGQFLNTELLMKLQGDLLSKKNGLVVVVPGVDRDEFAGSKPVLTMSQVNGLSTLSFTDLVEDVTEAVGYIFNNTYLLSSNIPDTNEDDLSDVKYVNLTTVNTNLEEFATAFGKDASTLVVSGEAASAQVNAFIQETMSILSSLNQMKSDAATPSLVSVVYTSLQSVATTHGTTSEVYLAALAVAEKTTDIVRQVFTSLFENDSTVHVEIITLPSALPVSLPTNEEGSEEEATADEEDVEEIETASAKKHKLAKRQNNNSPISSRNKVDLVCPPTAERCQQLYQNCSGRGECTGIKSGPKGQTCYLCKCANSRPQWTGDACQYQPLSSDFHLLFWTSVILLAMIVYTIVMMYAGAQDDGEADSGMMGSGPVRSKMD